MDFGLFFLMKVDNFYSMCIVSNYIPDSDLKLISFNDVVYLLLFDGISLFDVVVMLRMMYRNRL